MKLDLISTLRGSNLEGFFPEGWDLARMEELAGRSAERLTEREAYWNEKFAPVVCGDLSELEVLMGMEIAAQIIDARTRGEELAIILPVGPMGMYRWAVQLLSRWETPCDHVWGFNMDEWSDAEGNTLPPDAAGAFQGAMEQALYGPLGKLTVPPEQRYFASKERLPEFAPKINELRGRGAKLIVVYGIGRVLHIAFWEPQFAGEYENEEAWRSETHRIGAKLHPLTIEQNALTSFKSRTTLVPAFANTIGPGLFLEADYAIGGADGTFSRGMQWQGFSLWSALHYGPDPWVPASYMPTLPGKLFCLEELAGPLEPSCN